MVRYLARRLLSMIPVILGISLAAFVLGLLTPGDPAVMALERDGVSEITPQLLEAKREELGLDQPGPVRYLNWAGDALTGNLGNSYSTGTPVSAELLRRLPVTLVLTGATMLLVCIFGISAGLLSAAFVNRTPDMMIRMAANLLTAFPAFWLGVVLIMVFGEYLKVLPTNGIGGIRHLFLPSVTLASAGIAMTGRLMRSSMLEELGRPYLLAADAKGITRFRVLVCHAFPNAIIPVIALLGNYLGGIIGGSAIVETIFSLPGIGSYVLEAIHARDYPVIQGYVLFTGAVYVVIFLGIDLLCAWLDPRLRKGEAL